MVRLRGIVKVDDADAVLGHGIERTVVFIQRTNVMMHNRKGVNRCIIDERHRCEVSPVVEKSELESRIDGVSVIVVDQVFLEG